MSQQKVITDFFGKRKRTLNDDSTLASKRVLLDHHKSSFTQNCETGLIQQKDHDINRVSVKSVLDNDDSSLRECVRNEQNNFGQTRFCEKTKVDGEVPDLGLKKIRQEKDISNIGRDAVTFKLMGGLSPSKRNVNKINITKSQGKALTQDRIDELQKTPEKQIIPSHQNVAYKFDEKKCKIKNNTTDDLLKSAKDFISKIKETQKTVNNEIAGESKKELSLKEVKDRLKRSGRLSELKKSINKINEQATILIELESKKKENSVPKLSKFEALEVDVPPSPQKNALYSPSKPNERSLGKPAFERFNFLAEAGTTLPLPIAFQKLYELFRAVDTISSMMINRGEDLTFSKLKPPVQEMTRKTFTLRHLGQIAAVLPDAFSFHQEKVRNFGAACKMDRYELVITPSFPGNSQNRSSASEGRDSALRATYRISMTPRIIKARREAFYNALLDKTKDCHEEFLKSLDPPMHINRNDLKRWHPNFMVDHVPDIIPMELPQPPNNDKPATAKEVLERAKDFLSGNARLRKALETASQSSEEANDITSRVSPAIKEKIDSSLCNPLKGISKSLLEKVRARQAARALDLMRMSPQQEKETIMYTRLPAIARIVRTLFVNEQRGVLSWETALEKVQFSFNRRLGKAEMEAHVKLLIDLLPEWLSIVHIRNGNYLKMNPTADLTSVMNKLNKIVMDKTKNS